MIKFVRRWKYGFMLAVMVCVFAYAVYGISEQQTRSDNLFESFLEAEIEDDYDSCISRVDLRTTLYGILDAVVEGDMPIGSALNLTSVAGYSQLDPPTQAYLSNLDVRLDIESTDPSTIERIRDNYKEDFPIPDCDRERTAAREDLEERLDGG